MKTEITITSHELARQLLAQPDLPVFRHPVHDDDWEEGHLIPLSHVEKITSADEDGEPFRDCIVIDTALKP
jgi:hypothetical protein